MKATVLNHDNPRKTGMLHLDDLVDSTGNDKRRERFPVGQTFDAEKAHFYHGGRVYILRNGSTVLDYFHESELELPDDKTPLDIEALRRVLRTLQGETIPKPGHREPGAVYDHWKEVWERVDAFEEALSLKNDSI